MTAVPRTYWQSRIHRERTLESTASHTTTHRRSIAFRSFVTLALCATSILAGCGGGGTDSSGSGDTTADLRRELPLAAAGPATTCTAGTTLNVVAHEDDDLLFLNPDIAKDIVAGRCVRTVYFTAGDNNLGAAYWQGREAGIQAAYATMAGVANSWTTADAGITGKPAVLRTLSARPNVSVVFLRLPDGQGSGTGSSNNAFESLQKLYQGTIGTIRAIDGLASYDKPALTRAIAELIQGFAPDTVRTQNINGTYGDGDHSDHLTASYFVRDAGTLATAPYTLVAYADYVISGYASNVAGSDLTAKRAAWNAYVVHDAEPCGSPPACNGNLYDQWLSRQYTTGSVVVGGVAGTNLALGRTATASSVETQGFEPAKATDGDGRTRWSSGYSDNQWLQVDLGTTATINSVEVSWETAFASNYQVQVSTDGVAWTTVSVVSPASAGTQRPTFAAVNARFVRIACVTRGTVWGFSIYELKVYGRTAGSTSNVPPANSTACASEGGTCAIPAGATGTVWFGANTSWAVKTGVTGSIGCNTAFFGDPIPGTAKSCRVLLTAAAANNAPTVAIGSPANNTSAAQGSGITIAATASDSDGTVAKVDFFDGATLVGSVSAAPFTINWSAAVTGAHSLTARATDNSGATTTSAPVVVNVQAAATTSSSSPLFGSTVNGTPFTDTIVAGQALTGVALRAGWWIDSIQGLATPSPLPAHGGTGGGTYTAGLSAGEYLVRIYGQTGGGVVAQLAFMTNTGRVLGPYATATGVGTLTAFDYTVPVGNRVLGFTGRSGTSLNAIGVVYGPVGTASQISPVSPLFGSTVDGTPFTDPVVGGQALTGVAVRAGWWVDSVQGLSTPSSLPSHGGSGGGTYTASLAAGEYLVRIYGQTGGGVVAQLAFVTNTGRVLGPYATATGVGTLTPFDYTVPAGNRVLGFAGRSGTSLNAIGVVFGP